MFSSYYYVESWSDRYYETPQLVEELDREIEGATLIDFLSVRFTPPRDRKDLECDIYGKISFKIGQSDRSFTLFFRERENAARIVLRDRSNDFLTLPTLPGGFSPPPFKADPGWNRFRVTMELHERKGPGEEDVVIAKMKDLVHFTRAVGTCSFFEFVVESNFRIAVGFCAPFGAAVEIEVSIREPEEEEGGSPVRINAEIEVIQYLNDCGSCRCGQAVRTLYNNSELVCPGSKLRLLRNVVCLPMETHREQFLTILIRPDRDEEDDCILVDFPFHLLGDGDGSSFRTNQQASHTKDVEGTPFLVSITFLN